jgi:hypothetical protein
MWWIGFHLPLRKPSTGNERPTELKDGLTRHSFIIQRQSEPQNLFRPRAPVAVRLAAWACGARQPKAECLALPVVILGPSSDFDAGVVDFVEEPLIEQFNEAVARRGGTGAFKRSQLTQLCDHDIFPLPARESVAFFRYEHETPPSPRQSHRHQGE